MSGVEIKFSEKLGFSKLFCDYLYHPRKLGEFYTSIDMRDISAEIAGRVKEGKSVVEILTRQNKEWKAPAAVLESIRKLADKNAVAVVAGQQACLFGGPYLVILKALAVVRVARNLETELSVPVVPVFWIAADDHDYQEISYVDIFDISGKISRLALDFDPEKKYPPIGALNYDDSLEREIDKLQRSLPDNDFKPDALRPIAEIYRPGRKIVDCFAEYLLSLVGNLGLVVFNPYDREFKKYVAPVMRDVVEKHKGIKDNLRDANTALQDAGYHAQVEKPSSAVHLFYHKPERTAIHFDGDNFMAGETSFSKTELLDKIRSEAFDFSPDVLTRPLTQSYFFPVAAVIGGPAEIAYYAQMMPLFRLFDIIPPRIIARPSVTMVERRFENIMHRYEIKFDDLAGDVVQIVNRVLQKSNPDELNKRLSELIIATGGEMEKFKSELAAYDPGLTETAAQAGKKIDYLLGELGKKIFTAHKKKNKTERERIYRLQENLLPNGNFAERSIAPVYYISRYGSRLIEILSGNLTGHETEHRLLLLSEYYG